MTDLLEPTVNFSPLTPEQEALRKAEAMSGFIAGFVAPNNFIAVGHDPKAIEGYFTAFSDNYPYQQDQTTIHNIFREILGFPEFELQDDTVVIAEMEGVPVARQVLVIPDLPGAAFVSYLAQRNRLSSVG